ncbi:hypothetical protein J8L98_22990 [Pseudoalteromonas sp. MMG013]|uniref:Integrase n=1 Tax=Pseudoalteromonas aurantia 208 TaxID=1314867 RepID=A0ABR9E6C4_9GAMM|nr:MULTISPECIES: hypothetical protein [Pseudoalteromonas]MBE0366539.1 hypothetical protein [Pseudoalteromonas aurantia 208]MBQ4846651.1 hypothetical protein [Pseudoalteromonas sp. MMG005]MBQ4864552.1 hypothetical protein [Pseudoalteromonas sp. MMG013]
MGIRAMLKKELMNLDGLDLMTAEDVRNYLKAHFARVANKSAHSYRVISRFNEYHNQIMTGTDTKELTLKYERHRLFKDILYKKSTVQQWAAKYET